MMSAVMLLKSARGVVLLVLVGSEGRHNGRFLGVNPGEF